MTAQVEDAVQAAETFEAYAPPGIPELYAAWASGSLHWKSSQDFADTIADARQMDQGRVGEALLDLRVMAKERPANYVRNARIVKDWAYVTADEFVASRRGSARFYAYTLAWGHQAARDGLFRAIWPELKTPGREARSEQYGCSERQFVRVREHVLDEARNLLGEFEARLHGNA